MKGSAAGTLTFPDGPWPEGEALETSRISAALATKGLYLNLHMETVEHDEAASAFDPEDESLPDMQAPGAWANFHSTILSSTYWAAEGVQSTLSLPTPFSMDRLDGWQAHVDPLKASRWPWSKQRTSLRDFPEDHEFTFGIYAMGHGSVADHHIRLNTQADGTLLLDWRGLMANSYFGDYGFKYPFHCKASVPFHGLTLPASTKRDDAANLLKSAVSNPDDWTLVSSAPPSVPVVGKDARYVLKKAAV